ncbi:hypothetical protein LCGC14_1253970 [marine sediment metagenome]|uniref:Uncharacterized protein n=1 Tax=marine sediment metagenome TaxID=412755 RepID=A0A0F9L5N1_9ZZZZ
MSLFSKQELYCQICGILFETDFMSYDGIVCGKECGQERHWRRTLSILGKDYYPDSRKKDYYPEPMK